MYSYRHSDRRPPVYHRYADPKSSPPRTPPRQRSTFYNTTSYRDRRSTSPHTPSSDNRRSRHAYYDSSPRRGRSDVSRRSPSLSPLATRARSYSSYQTRERHSRSRSPTIRRADQADRYVPPTNVDTPVRQLLRQLETSINLTAATENCNELDYATPMAKMMEPRPFSAPISAARGAPASPILLPSNHAPDLPPVMRLSTPTMSPSSSDVQAQSPERFDRSPAPSPSPPPISCNEQCDEGSVEEGEFTLAVHEAEQKRDGLQDQNVLIWTTTQLRVRRERNIPMTIPGVRWKLMMLSTILRALEDGTLEARTKQVMDRVHQQVSRWSALRDPRRKGPFSYLQDMPWPCMANPDAETIYGDPSLLVGHVIQYVLNPFRTDTMDLRPSERFRHELMMWEILQTSGGLLEKFPEEPPFHWHRLGFVLGVQRIIDVLNFFRSALPALGLD